MNILKRIAAVAAAMAAAVAVSGCAPKGGTAKVGNTGTETEGSSGGDTAGSAGEALPPVEDALPDESLTASSAKTAAYIMVTGDGVNIRTGAGTSYTSLGAAEKNTLYALDGETNGWYKTRYRNRTAYIFSKYCGEVVFEAATDTIEDIISVGTQLLGTPYVYGAVRLHDGEGNLYKGFTINAFDCSSLMQYMFYYGAGILIGVNTRVQVLQGVTVPRSQLKRGDLMFFTNSSRYNKTGIERIGHVAMYLGNNYILHTASDYAKIEQINPQRWSYYIQSQRML